MIFLKQKRAISLIAAALILLSPLSGCGYNASQQRIYDAGQETGATQSPERQAVQELISRYQSTPESEEDAALMSRTVSLSPEALAAVETAADELAVLYPYADLMGVEAAYERYMAMPEYEGEVSFGLVTELPLDPEALFWRVKENNAAYMEENIIIKRFQLDDEYIRWACEIICEALNEELPALGSTAMLADTDSNLADLKISKPPGGGMSNASVTDDNCVYLNPAMIQNMVELFGEGADVKTVIHETEHIIQKLSTERREALGIERGYGFCVSWEDQPVNSIYFNWFIEASAEKLTAALRGGDALTYLSMIGYLDSLTFLTVLAGAGGREMPRLSQQHGLESVFELFGCEGEDERLELLQMLYAIEIIQSEPEDFMALFAQRLGREPLYDDITVLKVELKNAACQTMAKYFFRNLSRLVAAEPMSLREVLYLVTVFESDINLHITYDSGNRTEIIRPFLESYISLQQVFFDGVAQSLSLTGARLYELFAASHCRTEAAKDTLLRGKVEWEPVSISALQGDAKSFWEEYSRSVLKKRTLPIKAMLEVLAVS